MKADKNELIEGAKAGIPIVMGFIPVGIAYAIIAKNAGFTTIETVFMSLSVFAGASQMMAAGMYGGGAAMAAIVVATFIINLRHIIMSTCVFNRMEELRPWQKLLCGFFITDESFAVVTSRSSVKTGFRYMLALGTVTYLSWVAGSAIGALTVEFLPETVTASLGIALYAMFIGLLFPGIRGNVPLIILVVCTALLNTLLSRFLPSHHALIISTLSGAAAGTFFVEPDGNKNKSESGKERE